MHPKNSLPDKKSQLLTDPSFTGYKNEDLTVLKGMLV